MSHGGLHILEEHSLFPLLVYSTVYLRGIFPLYHSCVFYSFFHDMDLELLLNGYRGFIVEGGNILEHLCYIIY